LSYTVFIGKGMNHLQVRYEDDSKLEAGVDEAGRGCLWGPLYAAAVVWPPEQDWLEEHRELAPLIKDSKKISPKKRKQIASHIQNSAIDYGIGSVSALEIDQGGMSFANRLAFQRAIEGLSVPVERVLLDGCLPFKQEQLEMLKIEEQQTIVDGDAMYLPIAAASILAKEARDTVVEEWVTKEPDLQTIYNIGSCKGYGTEKHRKAVKEKGMHPQHRRLFLRKLLNISVNDCLISDDV
jgi:ribonuclease HII